MRNDKLFEQLHDIVENVRFSGRLVLAMGSGNNVRIMSNYLQNYGIKFQAILDNNDKLSGTYSYGLKIFKPETVLRPYKEKALILIFSPGYSNQMKQQLEAMGYEDGKHFYVVSNCEDEVNINDMLAQQEEFVEKGRIIYETILDRLGKDFFLVFMRGATGDVFLNGLYLSKYLEKRGIKNFAVLGDAKGMGKILKLFGIESVHSLTFLEAEAFQKYITFTEPENVKDVFMWQGSLYFNKSQARMHTNCTFLDTYSYFIYEGLVDIKDWIKPNYAQLDDNLSAKYEGYGMKPGKTIIVSPFAYSVKQLPIWFWDDIALELKKKGYEVFVNINEEQEINPFEHMKTVFFTFEESEAILTYAGFFLALRSGLCDIVALINKCKQVLIYPEEMKPIDYRVHRSDEIFSGFKNMGFPAEHITEISSKLVLDIVTPDRYINRYEENELFALLKNQIIEQF